MGYTTKFNGQFTLSKLPSAGTILKLIALDWDDGGKIPGAPDSYCQWRLTKDGRHIEWDQGEKFYYYDEWLQFIYDTLLKPEGIKLSGSVKFQGEDVSDSGILSFEDGKVRKLTHALVADELEELKRFRDFALNRFSYRHDLKQAWAEAKGGAL